MTNLHVPSGRELQDAKARSEERRTRMQAAGMGKAETSREERSIAAWTIATLVVVLMGGAAYLELGPVVAVATIVVLTLLILFVRRMFR